jgi:hypothetical protein
MRIKLFFLLLGCLCILGTPALAVQVNFNMNANDANGAVTSFNGDTQLHWTAPGAPVAAVPPDVNVYHTGGFLLRTPTTAANYTFAGDALRVGYSSTGTLANPFLTNGSVNNNSFINKTPLIAGVAPIITVNNLILDAGYVRDGMGQTDSWVLAGNMFVTANGGGFAAQCRFDINSVISGSGPIYVADNGNDSVLRTVYINSGLNSYNGNILLTPAAGSGAGRCRLTFNDDSLMNFDINASGSNNSITGAGTLGLNGDFLFDLTDASTNLLDSWTILGATTVKNYGASFVLRNFTDMDGNVWLKAIDAEKFYEFNESTGILTVVPEPATWIMLVLGAMGIAFYARKK